MSEISGADALDLAKRYKQAATNLGQYQLDNWESLTTDQRRLLTDEEYTLLDNSQNLATYAVGVLLDDAQASLDKIKQATDEANKAIQTVADFKKVLGIATALVTLAAAITAGNPGGIASAVGDLSDAVAA